MALNFPDSPSNGDTTTLNGVSYTYDSTKTVWVSTTGPITTVAVSDNAPTSPSDGDMWFNSLDLKLYIRYNDGTTSQWIIAAPAGPAGADSTVAGPTGAAGAAGGDGRAGVYANMAALIAKTGMVAGDTALVTALNKVFMYTGSAWYLIATMTNDSPTAITGVDGSYTLATDGTATTITAVSTDPEGFALTFSHSVTSGSLTVVPTALAVGVANSGASAYTLSGGVTGNNANVAIKVGQTVNFTVNASGHPFYIRDSNGGSNVSSPAATGQGAVSGVVSWTPNTVGTYYYQCGNHSAMVGTITVTAAGVTATVSQADNVFTITPSTDSANAGSFSLTFSVTDGATGAVNAVSAFTLSFGSWGGPTLTHSFAHTGAATGNKLSFRTESIDASETGEYVIAGAEQAAKAFIFKRTGTSYTQEAELSNYESASSFGKTVIINNAGDTAVVATGTDPGAAYVYTRSGTTWSSQQKLVSSDATANQQLGKNAIGISSDGNTLMLGAQNDDPSGNSTGAVYIFVRSGTTWTQQQKIKAPSGDQPIFFGNSGSISNDGNTIVAGAYYTPNWGPGAAYVYTRSGTTWSHQQKIVSSDIESGDEFGWSSDISGDGNYIVVGARNEDTGGSNQGSAYIFKVSGSTWSQEAIIRRTLLTDINGNTVSTSNRTTANKFATAVSINNDGSTVAIGTPIGYGNSVAITDGTCHVYTRVGTTWTEESFINNPSTTSNYGGKVGGGDEFGGALALSKDDSTLVISAHGFNTGTGKIYYYVQG